VGQGSAAATITEAEGDLSAFVQQAFSCSPEVARLVAARAADRRWPARSTLLRQGDSGAEVCLLIAGRAQALVYGLDGQLVLLHEYGPGDLFGAFAEPRPGPYEADVVAAEDSRAAVFSSADFAALIEKHGALGLAVARLLMRQLRTTAGRMIEGVTLSASGRVHAELLRLARAGDGYAIRPAPVLSTLAVRVHSTRETVSRTISALERRGLIRRDADALVIVAPHRLEEMVV
jgi:CRP-like cAMP-binding protein